jgi:outer membrane cobalamin receptor
VAERGRVHTRLSYVGARADRSFDPNTFAPSRLELPSYVLWTLGADWSLLAAGARRPSLTVAVRADNLLNGTYEEALGFRAPGRQIHVGVALGFGGGG